MFLVMVRKVTYMKKRVFVTFISIILVVCSVFVAVLADVDPDKLINEYKSIEFTYEGVGGKNDPQKSYFTYSDVYFSRNATENNGNIAKMSVALAMAAYHTNYINSVLDDMGFTYDKAAQKNVYDHVLNELTFLDNDHVAYTIAKKQINVGGVEKNVYVVPIKGTSGNPEWYSDFHLFFDKNRDKEIDFNGSIPITADDHAGFYLAANEVYNKLIIKLKNDNALNSNTVVLFTGHSRGAAVANILAARLTNDKKIPANQIFGYNFACPAVSRNADQNLTNIYNYNNPGDLITLLPLEGKDWGYLRNGIDVDVYNSDVLKDNIYFQFKRLSGSACTSADKPDDYVNLFKGIVPTREDYNKPLNQLIFRFLAMCMSKRWGDLYDVLSYDNWNGVEAIGITVAKLLVDLKIGKVPSNLIDFIDTYILEWKQHYFDYITFFANNRTQVAQMSDEEFQDFLTTNFYTIQNICECIDHEINTAEDFLACEKELLSFNSVLNGTASVTLDRTSGLANVIFGNNGDIKLPIRDGHTGLMYIVTVNARHCGYQGWYQYIDEKSLINNGEYNIRKVGHSCINNGNGLFELGTNCDTIDEECFYECGFFSKAVISDSVKEIQQHAFSSIGILSSVVLSKNLTKIGDYAFYSCRNITGKLVIPDGLTKIPFQAFYACEKIEELVIPESVTTIADQAFAFCSGLKRLTVPCHISYGVSESGAAFRETHNIEHVTITGRGKLGDYTSSSCLFTPWRLSWASQLTVDLSDEITDIGDYIFSGCDNLYSINIPDSVIRVGRNAFEGCSKWQDDFKLPSKLIEIGEQAFSNCSSIKGQLIIPDSVTTIGRYAFNRCYALIGKLELPSGITSIPECSFFACGFDEIVIPENVKSLYTRAFYSCEKLKKVTIPNGTYLEGGPFEYCTAIEYIRVTGSGKLSTNLPWFSTKQSKLIVDLDQGITEISDKAFYNCSYLYKVNIPNTVTRIGKSAFEKCTNLSGPLVLPEGLTEISELAFSDCRALNGQLEIPQTVTLIGRGAFNYCSGFSGVLEIPNGITSIPEIAFYSTGFEEVIIPGSVQSIDVKAFYSSNKLKKVTMPAATFIQNSAFEYCTNLKFFRISGPGEMQNWGSSPWYFANSEYTYLTTVEIDKGVTTISEKAFRRCSKLSQITIPGTVNKIGDSAFYNCDSLKDVYFDGTRAEWNTITIGSSNEYLKNATIHCTDTEYKIVIEKSLNGTVSASKELAYAGDKVDLTVTPDEGYKLESIKVVDTKKNEVAVENNSFLMPEYNVKITATFVKEDYTVTVSNCVNGSATVSKAVANFGDEIEITVTPDACYELDTIKVNGEDITGNTFTMPSKNATVEVTFKAKIHDLTPVEGKAATCAEDGYEAYYKCNVCGKRFSDAEGRNEITEPKVIKALGHSWDEGTTTKEPTCEETGSKLFECTREGCTESKTEELAALGHHLVLIKEKAPTKTEPGNISYYKCDREGCGKLFSDAEGKHEISLSDTVIPVMVHELTLIKAKDATCTEIGNTAYYVCKDTDCGCGKVYSDKYGQHEIKLEDTVISAKGHSIIAVDEKKATCTEDGYASHFECSNCHKKFSDSEGKTEINAPEVYPKLGHSWDEGEVTTQPGCETEGVKTFHCTREGCKSTKEEPIPALGHDKEHLKHVKAKGETYDEDGNIEYYICERCGKKFADPDCKSVLSDAEIVIPKKGAPELGDLVEIGNFKFQVTNPSTDGTGTLTFKGVIARVASVSVPATVTIKESSYIVNRIGTKAFYGDKTLKTVYIGNNVVIIDSYAFYGCSNLVKVSGGKALKTIGTKAFAYCSKLKSFSIASSVLNKIGSYAFQKDKKLKTIYIRYTTKLTKSGVKKSLKKSYVKTVKVKKSKVKKYKKYFKKSNSGRSVKVKK